jgi:hypothetical protein
MASPISTVDRDDRQREVDQFFLSKLFPDFGIDFIRCAAFRDKG